MKKSGLFVTASFTLLSTFATVGTSVTTAAPDAARERLNNFFTQVNTLQGSFTQQVFSKKNKLIQNSTGQISLNRPGKFRWVYKTPEPQVIVGDGKNIWIYDEDLEQVTIKPMSSAISSAPIALLTRKQSPDTQFHVKPMSLKVGGLDWFQLTPRKNSKDFKFIEIGLDTNGLRQMIMHDQLGQRTVIQLNTKKNVPISGSTFFFKVPAGVDVIGKAI
jgi:outer membrane lipoprotein carrier protein